MQNKEQVFIYIKDEIERLAKEQEDKYLHLAQVASDEFLAKIEKEASVNAKKQFDKELQVIERQQKKESLLLQQKHTKLLIEQRNEYVSTIFQEVKDHLVQFVRSEEYVSYLLESAKTISTNYDFEQPVLYVSSNDMKYKDQLVNAYGKNIVVEGSTMIQIGGCMVEDQVNHIVVDQSFDFKLEQQKEWFYQNSNLMIK